MDFDLEEENLGDEKKIQCSLCTKVCVSQCGLTRHTECKHPETVDIVEQLQAAHYGRKITTLKIPGDNFASLHKIVIGPMLSKRNLSTIRQYKVIKDYNAVYQLIKDIVEKFKGDVEKFYPDFYVLFKGGNIITELNHQCNILFSCGIG